MSADIPGPDKKGRRNRFRPRRARQRAAQYKQSQGRATNSAQRCRSIPKRGASWSVSRRPWQDWARHDRREAMLSTNPLTWENTYI